MMTAATSLDVTLACFWALLTPATEHSLERGYRESETGGMALAPGARDFFLATWNKCLVRPTRSLSWPAREFPRYRLRTNV